MERRDNNTKSEDMLYAERSLLLYEALTLGKGLQGILTTAEAIFNNPILIADTSFKVIAHIERPDIDNAMWKQTTGNGYYPNNYIQATLKNDDLYRNIYSNEPPMMLTDGVLPGQYMCKMIVVNGKPVGFSTCLEYDREITPLDIRLFDVFCKVVGSELRCDDNVKQAHSKRYEYFICEMLSGPVKSDFLEERMKQVGLKLKNNLFVLVAEFRDEKMRREHQMEYFRSIFEQVISAGHCVVFRNALVMLISQDHKMLLTDSFLETVFKQLEIFDMIGGISHRFRRIEDLNVYYKQACDAIRMGRRIEKNERLFDYGDMNCYHILDIVRQSEDLRNICNPKLMDIIEYDAEYNTNYAMTAYMFFRTNRNPALTAKRLDIHRNTIDYRIKRLEELFDLSFDNNETAFSFDLSFRILRFLAIPPFTGKDKNGD